MGSRARLSNVSKVAGAARLNLPCRDQKIATKCPSAFEPMRALPVPLRKQPLKPTAIARIRKI